MKTDWEFIAFIAALSVLLIAAMLTGNMEYFI